MFPRQVGGGSYEALGCLLDSTGVLSEGSGAGFLSGKITVGLMVGWDCPFLLCRGTMLFRTGNSFLTRHVYFLA